MMPNDDDDEEEGVDQVILTDVDGESRSISFPGCYRAKVSFRMKKPIINPYIEAFLQLGQNIPCRSDRRTFVSNICTNITQTNWCPQSQNSQLRRMLIDKETCQFCHICDTVKGETHKDKSDWNRYIIAGGSEECDLTRDRQTFQFKMCSPSRAELNDQNNEERNKLEEYWNYLKQGVLTAVVHVMDRSELTTQRRQQCQKMCKTYSNRRGISQNYRTTLLKSIESLCTPFDEYAACVYHTVKFDINTDL
ncbi:hypothetical protein DICVIV_09485 [Dictyocaulus viviparus]|uniref:Uncharacterized protein n=1 Tax=Dictyocaulus viviparus TaxID=29172 RepID=A0A0D8XL13_DICVI|nr:hypothetical protein DICVIV_09485 [Dictyocaulus viviparus]